MTDPAQRKLALIDLIMHIHDDALLQAIERQTFELVIDTLQRPNPFEGVTTIRAGVSLEQIKLEQGTQRLNYSHFQTLARKVELVDSIDELLEDLNA